MSGSPAVTTANGALQRSGHWDRARESGECTHPGQHHPAPSGGGGWRIGAEVVLEFVQDFALASLFVSLASLLVSLAGLLVSDLDEQFQHMIDLAVHHLLPERVMAGEGGDQAAGEMLREEL